MLTSGYKKKARKTITTNSIVCCNQLFGVANNTDSVNIRRKTSRHFLAVVVHNGEYRKRFGIVAYPRKTEVFRFSDISSKRNRQGNVAVNSGGQKSYFSCIGADNIDGLRNVFVRFGMAMGFSGHRFFTDLPEITPCQSSMIRSPRLGNNSSGMY